MDFIVTTTLLLFLVMDPLGNMPFFISTLRQVPPGRYYRIILREGLIALAVLAVFLLLGRNILDVLQISQASVGIAGGIILFLIALKMVFGVPAENENRIKEEPFIVPLAIPMVAGPSAMATVILLRGKGPDFLVPSLISLVVAWSLSVVILLFARTLARILGHKVIDASESLMGLLLTALAIEMFIKGIKSAFLVAGAQ